MLDGITKRPSAMVLIVANLLPLFGVMFWGWSVFNIVLLYWMENLVIGGINILKMIACRPEVDQIKVANLIPGKLGGAQRAEMMAKLEEHGGLEKAMHGHAALKLFMIPFFAVHYFGFCAGHGVFVFSLFGNSAGFSGPFASFGRVPELLTGAFGLAALGLVLSHLYSFFANYLGNAEYRRTVVPVLMFKPYGRIVVLHIAIIFGGGLVMALGSPVGLLLVLVVGKIALDLGMHLREHREPAGAGAASAVGGLSAAPGGE